jgi:SAM-dependent methyltransferase
LLNEEYEIGGCEDIEFSYKAEQAGFQIINVGHKGDFPIYHVAEGTVHDPELVNNYSLKFHANELKLAKKYNLDYYRFLLSNNYERAVFLNGDGVFPRELIRYKWANKNILGKSILEVGCSTGYGSQFFRPDISYLGVDYDPIIVEVAKEQHWGSNRSFINGDINAFEFPPIDTIIAFEVIEHLDNGMEMVEMLKKHCKRLLITVPYNEPKGFWGEHHKLHGLTEKDFNGFQFEYINEHGQISNVIQPITKDNKCNLMIGKWDSE